MDSNTPLIIEKEKLLEFAEKLEIAPTNLALLQTALTHRSFINESKSEIEHNERLEFLGDAVLELIITEYLFEKYPDRSEGDLTSFRAALVRTESLADSSTQLGLGEFIIMSKGEESTGGRVRPYILANTFEAVLGFLYLDQGIDTCKKFIKSMILEKLDKIVANRLDIDNKSKLQEIAQEKYKITPTYELVGHSGPDHEKIFTLKVILDGHEFGRGEGYNKQIAAQNAAGDALKNWSEMTKRYFGSK